MDLFTCKTFNSTVNSRCYDGIVYDLLSQLHFNNLESPNSECGWFSASIGASCVIASVFGTHKNCVICRNKKCLMKQDLWLLSQWFLKNKKTFGFALCMMRWQSRNEPIRRDSWTIFILFPTNGLQLRWHWLEIFLVKIVVVICFAAFPVNQFHVFVLVRWRRFLETKNNFFLLFVLASKLNENWYSLHVWAKPK